MLWFQLHYFVKCALFMQSAAKSKAMCWVKSEEWRIMHRVTECPSTPNVWPKLLCSFLYLTSLQKYTNVNKLFKLWRKPYKTKRLYLYFLKSGILKSIVDFIKMILNAFFLFVFAPQKKLCWSLRLGGIYGLVFYITVVNDEWWYQVELDTPKIGDKTQILLIKI